MNWESWVKRMLGKKIQSAENLLSYIRLRYLITPAEFAIADGCRPSDAQSPAPKSAPLVAMQGVEDPFYLGLFGEITSALRRHGPIRAHCYILRGFREGASKSLRHFLHAALRSNRLTDWKWSRLYGFFCDCEAYRSTEWISPIKAIELTLKALRIWRYLNSADDVAALTVDGFVIGDLIGDSYLRFKPAVTIDIKDLYLPVVIRQALKDLYLARRYFQRHRPDAYMTSYTSYVQHGIPARVAVAMGIRILAFGNYQEFSTAITDSNLSHAKPGDRYARDFLTLPDRTHKLETSRRQLTARVSGRIDSTILYMKNSAYTVISTDVPDVSGAVVIFLHDFYDSPHCYRWMLFNDFWEWTCCTIETLQEAGRPFFVKPHPNQRATSATDLERLRQKYPHLQMISPNITNVQLAEAGMDCAVTVHGTVASEVAFLGVPSISCGDNPYISFDFSRVARSKQEYRELLRSFGRSDFDPKMLQDQACMFHYMHNLNLDAESIALRDEYVRIRTVMTEMFPLQDERASDVVALWRGMAEMSGFRKFISELYDQFRLEAKESRVNQCQGSLECLQTHQS